MPSPHESTRPVSRTAIEPSKPLISLFSISLISEGRMSAIGLIVRSGVPGKLELRLREPRRQAAVVSLSAELGNYAAEQLLIDLDGRNNLFPGNRFQPRDHAFDLLVRGLNREGESGALAPQHLVHQIAVGFGDGADFRDASVARDDDRERSKRKTQFKALRDFRHRLLPRGLAQLRRGKARLEVGRI